jgi:hypothetical protein
MFWAHRASIIRQNTIFRKFIIKLIIKSWKTRSSVELVSTEQTHNGMGNPKILSALS